MDNEKVKNTSQKDLVVIGSSAGGVEALSVLVSTLPIDFPAPIVLAQHLDPTRPSTLDEILQRRTQLPIEVITDQTMLQAGTIYVAPSNRHLSISDHSVEILEDRSTRPRPSVDTLLSTASTAYGEHLIAVILTGSGSDGAMGAIDVKNAGGTIIIQNLQTARYPAMPSALPPSVVDFEVDVEQIGPLLYDLLTNVNIPPTGKHTDDALHSILEQVSHHVNIDFRSYKNSTILRRISRRMIVTHSPTMHDYADYLHAHAEEADELVNAFLINVTQFFRDPEAFEHLRTDVLPKLINRGRAHNHTLRLWDAGCATGEEPYSLAMLIADLLGAELSQGNVKIFATDLDEAAINFARRGLYSENLLKGIPDDYRKRFFDQGELGYSITKILRQMVIFGQQDLTRSAPFPRIDLILCRNVLIYFTPELQEYVLNQFAFSLAPDGYLFLGKAETVRSTLTFYELIDKHWKIYHCTGNVSPAKRHQALVNINTQRMGNRNRNYEHHEEKEQDTLNLPFEMGQLRRFNELILRFLPIGIVVIDRNYRILTANSTARRLLGLREAGLETDFLHAVHGAPYHEMRTSIDTVLRQHVSVNLPEVELETAQRGHRGFLSLSFALMQLDATMPELVVISATDITQQVQARHQLEKVQQEQTNLVNELGSANARLSDMNKDLIDSNEKLQISNEELLLTHEELQASIEEFETTNEELQSTNEEMETNNEELQATNEEMETTNDELRARTNELQTLSAILASERGRLAEMVELAPFYIMVLRGPNLIVEAYNPRYAQLLDQQAVQGRPLDEVIDLFWEKGLEIVHLARDTYHLNAAQETRRVLTRLRYTQDQPGGPQTSYFRYTAVPSRDPNGKVNGVLLYALDETAERLREVEEERTRLRLIFNNVSNNISLAALALFDAQTGELLIGSTPYLVMYAHLNGISQESLIGRKWHELRLIIPSEQATPIQEQATYIWETVVQKRTVVHIPELAASLDEGGQESIWDYTAAPLLGNEQQEQVHYVLVSLLDITAQVQARRELEQIDLLKDEFLSLAAHELRTPLTTIQGNVQMLRRILSKVKGQPSTEAELTQAREREMRTLDTIAHQVTRMNRLIAEMLDITRIHGNMLVLNKVDSVDLVVLVQHVIEPYQVQGREIILHTNNNHFTGTYDPDRIEQVLTNLVNNAVKYSPADTPIVITMIHKNPEYIVAIRDEGAGISVEDQEHLFERFYRTEEAKTDGMDGLGLGLYISHEIITQHQGQMWCESEKGSGSTFSFSLPA